MILKFAPPKGRARRQTSALVTPVMKALNVKRIRALVSHNAFLAFAQEKDCAWRPICANAILAGLVSIAASHYALTCPQQVQVSAQERDFVLVITLANAIKLILPVIGMVQAIAPCAPEITRAQIAQKSAATRNTLAMVMVHVLQPFNVVAMPIPEMVFGPVHIVTSVCLAIMEQHVQSNVMPLLIAAAKDNAQ